MIKMLTFILLCSTGLCVLHEQPKQIKEFYSGRSGYWHHTLRLYDNSGYSYTEWAHMGYSLRDTGNFELTSDRIKLKSLQTKIKERHLGNKKRQEQIERKHKGFKKFRNKTFGIENDVILITGRKKLKNSIDSMEFFMTNLFEVEVERK